MRLNTRSYPHPVVGNQDDVPHCACQATAEHSSDRDQLYLSFKVDCSSQVINRLIQQDVAHYVVHVECSNTLFRRAWTFKEDTFMLAISLNDLCDSVEINVAICATRHVSDYSPDGMHEDYGDSTFEVGPGDFLAVTPTMALEVYPNFESLGRVGSIMEIHASSQSGDSPMSVVFESSKIQIILSQNDFRDYAISKANPDALGLLMCAIVLPVLIEATRHVLTMQEEDIVDGKRWQKVLYSRIKELGKHAASDDPFEISQVLLELPVKRALTSAVRILEGGA